MLNAPMLSVFILNPFKRIVIIVIVILLNVTMMNVPMLSVFIPNVFKQKNGIKVIVPIVERYGSCHSGEIRMGSMARHQASLK